METARLCYFEWFCRSTLNYGQKKFIDYYKDGNGTAQGVVRIVDGKYKTSYNGAIWMIECELEVFR